MAAASLLLNSLWDAVWAARVFYLKHRRHRNGTRQVDAGRDEENEILTPLQRDYGYVYILSG